MQLVGGISRYFTEIIRNLPESCSYELPAAYSRNVHLNESSLAELKDNPLMEKYDRFLPGLTFRGKRRLHRLRNAVLYRNFTSNRSHDIDALKRQDFDVFHPTYYDPYFLDYIGKKPFVLTIHDMIHEKFPEMLCDAKLVKDKRTLVMRASHIIAISEHTKRDVMDFFSVPEEKITVIYHSVSRDTGEGSPGPDRYGKYILFTGTRINYKNFYFMLIALSDWLKGHPDVKLLCTSSGFSEFEESLIEGLGLKEQVLHVFYRGDAEMRSLYHNAFAFVFPSYYEGFGMPVLEAFVAGCPVILADASCFREIAGDAALYFGPKDKGQLVSAVNALYEDMALRASLVEKGRERLKDFSWSQAAARTAGVYDLVCRRAGAVF